MFLNRKLCPDAMQPLSGTGAVEDFCICSTVWDLGQNRDACLKHLLQSREHPQNVSDSSTYPCSRSINVFDEGQKLLIR